MSKLVYSGYEPLTGNLPQVFDIVEAYQRKWAVDNGYNYLYDRKSLISEFEFMLCDFKFSSGTRRRAMMSDITRIYHIREKLRRDNEEIIWLDGDLLPLKGFTVPTENLLKSPSMLREMMMQTFYPDKRTASFGPTRVTITIMRFTKDHFGYLNNHLNAQWMINETCAKEKPEWWIFGTSLVTNLHNLIEYNLINGTGFVTQSTLEQVWNSPEKTKIFFDVYNDKWSKYNCKLTSLNLSTNKDEDKLYSWVRLLEREGYL